MEVEDEEMRSVKGFKQGWGRRMGMGILQEQKTHEKII